MINRTTNNKNLKIEKLQKILIITALLLFTIVYFVYSTPTWVLSYFVNKYSQHTLDITNQNGTFWKGHGLLVIINPRVKGAVPLMNIDWQIKLGMKKFVQVDLSSFNNTIANISIDKKGLNISNLSLIFSLSQTSQMLETLHSLDLAGTIKVTSVNGINITPKGFQGSVDADIYHLSSTISPLNPLGDYHATIALDTGSINVSTTNDAIIKIDGSGSMKGLSLNATVQPEQKDKLLQFMVMFGDPVGDNQYVLKLI